MPRRLACRAPLRGLTRMAFAFSGPAALVLPHPRPRRRHSQLPGSGPGGQTLPAQHQEPGPPPPVGSRAAYACHAACGIQRVPGKEAAPERVFNVFPDTQMMTPRAAVPVLLVPLQHQRRDEAELELGGLDTQALLAQHHERLAQPAVPGLLADPGGSGGRFETAPLLHRSQEPHPGSRIPSQVHRATAFHEGVASTDRTWAGLSVTPCRAGADAPPGRPRRPASGRRLASGPWQSPGFGPPACRLRQSAPERSHHAQYRTDRLCPVIAGGLRQIRYAAA